MSGKYRNIFLWFGIAAIVVMLCTFDVEYDELKRSLLRAGVWFPVAIGLWVVIYLMNALAWYLIIRDDRKASSVSFWWIYKLTITGFALNYATPCGLMGGEPYRIMELSPHVGASKAASSVILHAMTHIFSHFCFWLFSVVLYVSLYRVSLAMGLLLTVITAFCVIAIYFFLKGYRNGMAVKTLHLLCRIPIVRKWACRFSQEKADTLLRIDCQIAELHRQRRVTFLASLALEFLARIVGCLEVLLILNILTDDIDFITCILIMAFTSLFSNALFFSPMQLGAREGGFALSVHGLQIPSAYGVFTGLITRVRELVWIAIGMALMKIGNKPSPQGNRVKGVIFDYGGTIDTNSRHWAAVLWENYQEAAVACQYEHFREAYVFAERALAKFPYIRPDHNFLDVLRIKVKLELEYLAERGFVNADEKELCRLSDEIAWKCYEYVRRTLLVTRPVLERLSHRYKLVLVSNFYGNIHTILKDFALDGFFSDVIESSVVGVRKPDPAIYQLGVNALGLSAGEVLVVGDSFSKDIVPAKKIGCQAVWLRGEGWGHEDIDETLPDQIVSTLEELTLND